MPPNFSKAFQQSSKDNRTGHLPIPEKYEDWPETWKTTYYKTYQRLPRVILDGELPGAGSHSPAHVLGTPLTGEPGGGNLFELVKKRQSRRDFTRVPVTARELSLLLKYSCGNTGPFGDNRHRRAQPSAGARFPIEVYPIVFRDGEEVPAGLYHYNVKEHALDILWKRKFSDRDIDELFSYRWVKHAAIAIVMTSVFWRNQDKYGERGYRYILLEAGHVGQSIYLASAALGLKCCALGGTRDEALEQLLDIDGITESVIYALAVGN